MSTLTASRLTTAWTVLRICIAERLIYRGDFALGTLMRFLPIVTQVFLWASIFRVSAADTIAGYHYGEMVAYYLLTMVSRAFSSMPGLASAIALDIRQGTIKKYLVQPIDMLDFLLLSRVAHKLVYYSVALGPYALVFFLCRDFFPGWPQPANLAAFLLSLMLSFLLGFLIEATIGMIGFWFLEVSSLLFVYMLFNFFISGHMFPIDILPGPARWLAEAIPLQYLAYFPAAVFLEKITGSALALGLALQTAWVVAFWIIARATFRLGVRRYSAFGG